jgi:hypothetical protein
VGLSGSEKGKCKMVDFSLSRDGEKMEIDFKKGCIDNMKRHEQVALYLLGRLSLTDLAIQFGVSREYLKDFDEELYKLIKKYVMKEK